MSSAPRTAASILIASDNSIDAALVKKLLAGAFDNVFTSTEADRAVEDFERRAPQVLVLAFNTLAKSERYCLGLYRLGSKIQSQPHRTLILCDKEELRQVSELCIHQSFDDYVLFWPLNHDAPRLRLSVHHALRALAVHEGAGPSAAEFAARARRLSELEALLDQQMALGGQRIEVASLAIEKAEHDVGAALDGFTRRLSEAVLADGAAVTRAASLEREVARLREDAIERPFRVAAESMQPLRQWVGEFRQECAPHLESARAMVALVDQMRPTVLVVDDDQFQHKIVAKILEAENCRLVFAASAADALEVMGKQRPDLVLMDVQMSEMDGIEATRRLKAVPAFAHVPVIMITGKSEGNVVVDSLRAGAADFVVKPYVRDTLIAKVARWMPGERARA